MRKRGYTAPAIVAACLVVYYGGIALLFALIPDILWWVKALMCIVPLAVCALVIYVLLQRMQELNSGEEDDLDQY